MVPNGWERKPLEKVAEIRTGVAKGKKGLKDPIEVPYLRVANVQDGHIDLSEVKTIKIERHQLERYSLQVGDVLMTEGGDFDKLGRGDVWQGQITPCLNQNHVFAVRPNNQILLPYFLAALSGSNYGKTYFLSCAKRSTNLASINSTQLKEFPVLLPPLPEQRKIAKTLSTWDKAIATTEKLIETSKQQKKALMQQLLTGKKRLVNPETGKAFEGEWEEATIASLFNISTGKSKSKFISEEGKFLIVDMGSISREGKLIASKKTSHEGDFLSLGQLVMPKDDIGGGQIIGRTAYIPENGQFVLSDHVYLLTPKSVNSLFATYLINSWGINKQLRSKANGTAQLGLGKKDVEKQKLVVPTLLQEQQKIASVLTAADKEIEVLEDKLAHFKQEKKALMQQLLTGKRRVKVDEMEAA
ncbi:restriction endonuclease subunit S [Vibrio sp. VGrn 2]|uniref:restriction endonuclease subunit S n=1 Tax=Vibrio sp. VGrn 2 TaxID=2419839 RepID=UPI00128D17EB|nr:restriction endonuclease subunit S [Vibrio sp. VGrn 2]MPS37162.1 restriction endonuclease subunit S [Vibrio sp. VGrn 2]